MPIRRFLRDLRDRLTVDPEAIRRVEQGRSTVERRMAPEAERLLSDLARFRDRPRGERTMVMGLAANYGVAELAPFVRSLRDGGYADDVTILTYGCDADTAGFLRAHGVRMVPFVGMTAMPMSMNSARMFRYLDWFLERFQNADDEIPYGRVLLTDVRDVVFQGNPFTRMPEGRVVFFLESERTIGTCPINGDWMARAYGWAVRDELADRPVSCAGTLVGTSDGLLEYLIHMVRDILRVPPQNRFTGVDQAIHNHILARGLIDGAIAVPNGGVVMTVPSSEPTGIRLLDDGSIVNPDGGRSEVVHQYDRDPIVNAAITARYAH